MRILPPNWFLAAVLAVLGIGTTIPARGADATAESVSISAVVDGMASGDYHAREQACHKLEATLTQQALLLAQVDDVETQARLVDVLEFNDGLTRWVLDVLRRPQEERKEQFSLVAQSHMLPVLVKVFSEDPALKIAGIETLGKLNTPASDVLLGGLIDDPNPAVAIAAMEAVWNRNPTAPIVSALWSRGVEFDLQKLLRGYPVQITPAILFRGQPVPGTEVRVNTFHSSPESRVACEVLAHLQPPQLGARLAEALESVRKAMEGEVEGKGSHSHLASSDPVLAAYRLAAACKPKEAIPALYALATAPVTDAQTSMRNTPCFTSNRTSALGVLLTVTNQNPVDYQLIPSPFFDFLWASKTRMSEDEAVMKLQKWWNTFHPAN